MAKEEKQMRTLRLEIRPADKEMWKPIKNEIHHFRAVCNQASAALHSLELLGATIEFNKEGYLQVNCGSLKQALEARQAFFGREKGDPIYHYVRRIAPDLKAELASQVNRIVLSTWKAKDAKFKATRRFLAVNGARNCPRFNGRGIPIKHDKSSKASFTIAEKGHRLSLSWSRELGPVEFRLGDVDPSNWAHWRKIVSGDLEAHTPTLNLQKKKGKDILVLYLSYEAETKEARLDDNRVFEAAFNEDDPSTFFVCKLVEGHKNITDLKLHYELNAVAALDKIDTISTKKNEKQDLKKACGSMRARDRGEGHGGAARAYSQSIGRLSIKRNKVVKDWNHKWTRQFVRMAIRHRCKTLKIMDIPSTMFGRPWQWDGFKQILDYKCKEVGINLELGTSPAVAV